MIAQATLCARCSAHFVRFTDEGEPFCHFHWYDHVLGQWAAHCTDPWYGRQVLETMLRAARPLTEERIVELVSYHPLKRTLPEERAGLVLRLEAGVEEALGELVAAGVLSAGADGMAERPLAAPMYAWSEAARERVHA